MKTNTSHRSDLLLQQIQAEQADAGEYECDGDGDPELVGEWTEELEGTRRFLHITNHCSDSRLPARWMTKEQVWICDYLRIATTCSLALWVELS